MNYAIIAAMRRKLIDALLTVDHFLGGGLHQTTLQKWVARHPLATGFWTGGPFALFLAALTMSDDPSSKVTDLAFASAGGCAIGTTFYLCALLDRWLRHNRLRRLGLDGRGLDAVTGIPPVTHGDE
jgi:hypothetical protein